MSKLLEMIEQLGEQAAIEYGADHLGGHKYADTIKAVLPQLLPALKQAGDAAPAGEPPSIHITVGVPGQPPLHSETVTLPAPISEKGETTP